MTLNKKYYWLIGGVVSLVLYFLGYLYINYLASTEPNLALLAISIPLVLPCHLLGLNKLGNAYVCAGFSVLVYFLLGSLIGFLVYKIRKNKK